MLKPGYRSKVLLSLEQEVKRQTTEEQIAENEGHEQFKESQRIEPAAKVQGGTGAANNLVHFNKELKKFNFLVMTLITTVTFAAAFQMPGGYDGHGKANLVKSRDFRKFLIYDSLSFGTSAFSLLCLLRHAYNSENDLCSEYSTASNSIAQYDLPFIHGLSLFGGRRSSLGRKIKSLFSF